MHSINQKPFFVEIQIKAGLLKEIDEIIYGILPIHQCIWRGMNIISFFCKNKYQNIFYTDKIVLKFWLENVPPTFNYYRNKLFFVRIDISSFWTKKYTLFLQKKWLIENEACIILNVDVEYLHHWGIRYFYDWGIHMERKARFVNYLFYIEWFAESRKNVSNVIPSF